MTVVRPDRGRAAGKGCEDEDGTERRKKNGSHNYTFTPLVPVQPILCEWIVILFKHGRLERKRVPAPWELALDLRMCAGKSRNDHMGLIILIVVILLLVGAFTTGGYGFGYASHGIIGTILIIVLILYLLGRL